MSTISDILSSTKSPKVKAVQATNSILNDGSLINELMEVFRNGSDVEKGHCAEIMQEVTAEKPELLLPFVDELISYINYKAPRVKWGVPESIGNIAKKYPEKVTKAIPFLLQNTEESKINTTVVRWCAAYGLSEIVKSTKDETLIKTITDLASKEKNNGVKNVYLKAIKYIEKNRE